MFPKAVFSVLVALTVLTSSVLGTPIDRRHQLGRRDSTVNIQFPAEASSLPPPGNAVLKYVMLGVGTQNYTCTPGSTDPPGTTGAKATLYDISKAPSYMVSSLPGLALSLDDNNLLNGLLGFAKSFEAGHHFFTSAKVPTFALDEVKADPFPLVYGKKNGTMTAPARSCPGKTNEGAVPWLQLIDAGGSQGGVNMVYRLFTAGGAAPATCANTKTATFEVDYAAAYFIYGPASTGGY